MERYRLSWIQSTSDFANKQEVRAQINGAADISLAANLIMTVNSVEYDFPTDASVNWWVVTTDDTGTKTAKSADNLFQAVNLATLEPATGLTATWVAHLP